MKNKNISKEIKLILAVFFSFIAIQIVVSLIATPIIIGILGTDIGLGVSLTLPHLVALLIYYRYIKKKNINILSPTKNNTTIYSLLLGLTYIGVGMLLVTSLQNLLGKHIDMSTIEELDRILNQLSEGSTYIFVIILITILAPIAEELLFRGIFMEKSFNNVSARASIIISALIFGISHLNIMQFVNATILGLLLAYIYYKTRNIKNCIALHLGNNTMALVLGYLTEANPRLANVISIILAIIFIGLLYKFIKDSRLDVSEDKKND